MSNNPVMLHDPSGMSGGTAEERPRESCDTNTITDPTGKESKVGSSISQSEDKKRLTNSAANGNWDFAEWTDIGEGKGYYKIHYKSAGQQFSEGFVDGAKENLNGLVDAVTSPEGVAALAAGVAILYFVPGAGQVLLGATLLYMAYESVNVAEDLSEGNYYEAGKGTGELAVDAGVILATEGAARGIKAAKSTPKPNPPTVTRSASQGSETLDDMARMTEQPAPPSPPPAVDKGRIEEFRSTNTVKSGNLGFIEGEVNGIKVDNKMWPSGKANLDTEPQIFEAIEVKGWTRNTDSEYKMLNQLASTLGAQKGGVYPDVTGEIAIVSENIICDSCMGVIRQFQKMFPNIKIHIHNGTRR